LCSREEEESGARVVDKGGGGGRVDAAIEIVTGITGGKDTGRERQSKPNQELDSGLISVETVVWLITWSSRVLPAT
jgi:hypothetical protein